MKYKFLNSTFRFLQKLKIQNKKLKIGFNKTKGEIITCLIYVNLVTKPFYWSKDETAWTSSLLYTKPLEKNAFHLLWTEITEVIFSIIKVALQQFREPFSKRHTVKEKWRPKKGPYQCWSPMKIVYKGNFKNFFLACVVTYLGQVHFMRNYFFTVNTTAEQLLLQRI